MAIIYVSYKNNFRQSLRIRINCFMVSTCNAFAEHSIKNIDSWTEMFGSRGCSYGQGGELVSSAQCEIGNFFQHWAHETLIMKNYL